MIKPEPRTENDIRKFVNDNWEFFARWDSGRISLDRIEWLEGRDWDDRILVNDGIPGSIATKDGFRDEFLSMHGRFSHDPVTARIEFLVVAELAPNVYVVTYHRHYDFSSGETTSVVITEILVQKGDELRVQYIHE